MDLRRRRAWEGEKPWIGKASDHGAGVFFWVLFSFLEYFFVLFGLLTHGGSEILRELVGRLVTNS
jgi:hypothetical protein